MNLDNLLQNMDEALGHNFDNFEEATYEVENLLVRSGIARPQAKVAAPKLALKMISNNSGGSGQAGSAVGNWGNSAHLGARPFAAQFTFNVSVVISSKFIIPSQSAVPVPIFGYLDRINDYGQVINGLIPQGLSLTVTSNANDVIFTYSDGSDEGFATVTVSCNEYPYVSFLAATISNIFQLSKLRITLSDKTKLMQFATGLRPYERTMFGVDSKNTITLNANKAPSQFQDGIIDVDATLKIDKEKGIITYIDLNAGNNFQVSYSCFVQALNVSRS